MHTRAQVRLSTTRGQAGIRIGWLGAERRNTYGEHRIIPYALSIQVSKADLDT